MKPRFQDFAFKWVNLYRYLSALVREKGEQLANYKNELEASSRKTGELEGTVRKLQLNLKDCKQEADRMTNRMRLHDETAAKVGLALFITLCYFVCCQNTVQ